ncbi:MAG: M16 family metallopeptidase [Bacteroidota bacterium]
MKQWKIHRLSCGLQVLIVQSLESQVSHCGLLIGAGTREEEESEAGLAHFIEHCLFKGTRKRRAFHILNRLETVGGELNAYTTKEETCLHASVMDEHLERALELISDIAFH